MPQRREDVPEDLIQKEKEIYETQLKNDGKKPPQAWSKIIEGKINKLFFQAFCLLEQMSMRDNKTPLKGIIAEAAKAAGGKVDVMRITRYQLGGD